MLYTQLPLTIYSTTTYYLHYFIQANAARDKLEAAELKLHMATREAATRLEAAETAAREAATKLKAVTSEAATNAADADAARAELRTRLDTRVELEVCHVRHPPQLQTTHTCHALP